MARFEVPGGRKVGRPRKKDRVSLQPKTKLAGYKKKESCLKQIKPQVISIRRYREIFGHSDDEDEEFYGFRSEDLGLIAYRKLTSPSSNAPGTFGNKRKHGVLSSQSNLPRISPEKCLSPTPSCRQSSQKEREDVSDSKTENIYAKQYRKRDSYERKHSPTKKTIPQVTEASPKLKSTSQVKFNFAPRGIALNSEINKLQDHNEALPATSKTILPINKRKPQTVAQMLLAKAKGGKSLKIRKQQQVIYIKPSQPVEQPKINQDDNSQVRSRSGRVVKAKKLDYDDLITSPRCEPKKVYLITSPRCEPKKVTDQKNNSVKRTLDEPGELPAPKIQRMNEVDNTDSQSRDDHSQSSQDTCQAKTQPIALEKAQTNVKRKSSRTVRGRVRDYKKFESCGKTSLEDLEELKPLKERKKNRAKLDNKDNDVSEHEKDIVSVVKTETGETPKPIFKSKRLQQLQEENPKQETSSTPDTRDNKEDKSDEESDKSSNESEDSEEESTAEDEWKPLGSNKACSEDTNRRQSARKKTHSKTTNDADNENTSSTDDEDNNKPLAIIKKEIKESPEKVVTRVIKVMRKIKMKNGEIKKTLVKVIRKVKKVNNKNLCPKVPGMRRVRCRRCIGCVVKNDCGECVLCLDKPKFGGTGTMKQACKLRRCVNPQPPRAIESLVAKKDGNEIPAPSKTVPQEKHPKKPKKEKSPQKKTNKTVSVKPKTHIVRKKKELKLRAKHGKKLKTTAKECEQSEAPPSVEKTIFSIRQKQRPVDSSFLVKLPWSDNASEETIWKEGYGVCFTTGIPEAVQECCYLCGSSGLDKMFYCKVCAEPFHGFCLDEEPIDKSTWCCDNCSTCVVCGLQDKLLMCDVCQRGYHVECLGPNYPTEPEGEDDTWICGRCVKCKRCGSRSAGDGPDDTWMHEFTHCYNCGTNWEQGNYCPICEKCYSDNDFDSKMMQCAKCEHWVHASCQDINPDQYECLSDLPDSIHFVCKNCCKEEHPQWLEELNEEMLAGFERVLDELLKSKSYEPLRKFFEEIHVDNGHPKDIEAIREKAKTNKYKFIVEFSSDVQAMFERVLKNEEFKADIQLFYNYQSLFIVFEREIMSMFPWHKVKPVDNKPVEQVKGDKPAVAPLPFNGFATKPIVYSSWDHSYCVLTPKDTENKDKNEPSVETLPVAEKMDVNKPSSYKECSISGTPPTSDDNKPNLQEESMTLQPESVSMETTKPPSVGDDVEMTESSSPKPTTSKVIPKSTTTKTSKSKKGINSAVIVKNSVKKMPEYTMADEELGLKSVLDTRKCQLCCCYGDDKPAMAGRLLCCGLDEWVHVNCGLWSAEVFEDDDKLQNVQTAITRGNKMRCEHCFEHGATVGCCEPRCSMNYHFICARNAKSIFQDDKKVFCDQHSFRVNQELIMEGNQFRVDRRVFVDLSKVRTIKKGLKGAEPDTIGLAQGSMKVESLGKLTEASDSKEGIFPIGFKVSRLYWSTVDPRRRCRYYCTIVEKPRDKVKTCAEDTRGMATTEDSVHRVISHDDTVHRVISHDDIEKQSSNKTIDLTCNESSKEILNSTYRELQTTSDKGATLMDHKGLRSPIKDLKGPFSPTKDQKGLTSTKDLKGPLSPIKDLRGPLNPTKNLMGPLSPTTDIRGPYGPTMDYKGSLGKNAFTNDKKHEISRILSGYQQILPSQPPPLLHPFRTTTTQPRKILLPNLPHTKTSLFSMTRTAPPLPPVLTSPLVSSLFSSQRRKAEPVSPGIAGLPKPKKLRKMSTINEEADKQPEESKAAAALSTNKDKLSNPKKEISSEKAKETCSKSPEKSKKKLEKPQPNPVKQARRVSHVKFVVTSDDGLIIESDSYRNVWRKIFEMVLEARSERLLIDVPFIGLHNVSMIGLKQESVVYMLEQLPGAHLLKNYKFKHHNTIDKNSNGELVEELKENPSGCCRTEIYKRSKKYDMFAFLASIYRTAPKLTDDADEQDWSEPNYEDIKRATALDLPMAMRYRQLKENNYNRNTVAVYRSGIHGRGLYCARNIAAGELVIEYSGQMIRSTLTDKRENYYDSKGIGCYMFRIDGINVVDATTSGNAARFINHSCECNCYSKIIAVDGKKKILIFASRSISRGEELTYDYKFPVEDVKLPCLCNSKRCRKYLN